MFMGTQALVASLQLQLLKGCLFYESALVRLALSKGTLSVAVIAALYIPQVLLTQGIEHTTKRSPPQSSVALISIDQGQIYPCRDSPGFHLPCPR